MRWIRPKLLIFSSHIWFHSYPFLPIPRMWKSITLSRPYGIGLPKSPDPKNVLKAENQITFKLCKSKFKTQPNPGLKILEDECLECSVQGLTDQSSFFFLNGRLLMKGFGTLIASLSKVDLKMIQTMAENIFSRTWKVWIGKLLKVPSEKGSFQKVLKRTFTWNPGVKGHRHRNHLQVIL